MLVTLVDPLRAYYEAANTHDTDALIACFASNAVVRDEGMDIHGLAAIRTWGEQTTKKYNVTAVPSNVEEIGHRTVVTTQISGTFDGSPVALRFQFTIVDASIIP